MATAAPLVNQPSQASDNTPPKPKSIKALAAELPGVTSIPSNFSFQARPNAVNDEAFSGADESIPIIDFSLLTSTNPDERSKAIQDLGKACEDWGFFMVINHGVSESMMKAITEAFLAFFDLPEEEKQEFGGRHPLDPINYGTSINISINKVQFWRDFLRVFLHPQFYSVNKPPGFSETAMEYGKQVRQVAVEILKGVSESLGLEADYIHRALNLENGLQFIAGNLYPRCPQPELAIGLPSHSDHGALTLLIQNGIGGLQVEHQGKWINIDPLPNSFLANIGDHIEILSNGTYKSVLHRAVVNNKDTRISIPVLHGPALDAAVSPAPELLDSETNPAAYKAMVYKEYLELQQRSKLDPKFCLNHVRV